MDFFYDSNGNAYALKYNGILYYYITNLQGDVMSIVDAQGAVVASYNYDPYGNLISDEPAENTVGHLNPLRYRGYYYDSESELYYLQSRYYDPELCRFLNADSFASTGQGILGNNMFAYCNNNPVTLRDSDGESATIAGGIVGGIFGFIGAVISEISDDEKDGQEGIRWDKVWECTVSSAFAGAAAGFVADVSIATCGAGAAIFISAAGGALCSAANSAYTQYTLTGDVDAGKVLSDALIGGVTNGLCTGTSTCLNPVVKGLKNGLHYASSQVAAELTPGLLNVGSFVVNDLIPTVITGFGAWYGGLAYDYATK